MFFFREVVLSCKIHFCFYSGVCLEECVFSYVHMNADTYRGQKRLELVTGDWESLDLDVGN